MPKEKFEIELDKKIAKLREKFYPQFQEMGIDLDRELEGIRTAALKVKRGKITSTF